MTESQRPSPAQLLTLLKHVSRSFYLSIKILPVKSRTPVCLAYLLARSADSIADCAIQDRETKSALLNTFSDMLTNRNASVCNRLVSESLRLITNPQERTLLAQLPMIVGQLDYLSTTEVQLIVNVVATLISGMQQDMTSFYNPEKIVALADDQALDNYIYRVAGCVGEFWTLILDLHYATQLQWNSQSQITYGINFGKALQLTNILRDVAKDASLGRCYLPADTLQQFNLTAEEYVSHIHQSPMHPVTKKYLDLCLHYYEDAEKYLLATPLLQWRLRMAAFWPITIGLLTLHKLVSNKTTSPAKIPRRQVYQLLLLSPFVLASNNLTQHYLARLRRQINY